MLAGIADRLIEAEDGAQALAIVAADWSTWCWPTWACRSSTAEHAAGPACPPTCPRSSSRASTSGALPRAAALLRKDDLTRERLAFAIRLRQPGQCDDRRLRSQTLARSCDDDEAKRYVIATWLRRAGHTVIEVGTGHEALAKAGGCRAGAARREPARHSGFEVCRADQGATRVTAAIPVIQVSATAVEVADRAHGLTQGADAYLVEPSEPEELLATVTAAASLLPGQAARRADRVHAGRAGQRDPGHQRRRDVRRAGGSGGGGARGSSSFRRVTDPADARRPGAQDVGVP